MASTRDIRTNQSDIACDVCGRTLLRGEHAETFLAGGSRREVCDLCTARAQHEGWIRESGGDELALRHTRHDGRGRSLRERLRARRERAREVQEEAAAAAEEPEESQHEPARAAAARARRPHQRGPQDAAGAGALQRLRPHAHGRRCRPLARRPGSLRAPRTDRPSVVSITVMWELSWYRFEVDLSDEAGGVRRDAQGDELSELPPEEQEVNAAADERGGSSTFPLTQSTFLRCQRSAGFVSLSLVIYCSAPEPLADELYPKLSAYYEDDPNVEVIVDRRKSERRDASSGGGQRETRDQRRPRVTGDFPPLSAA